MNLTNDESFTIITNEFDDIIDNEKDPLLFEEKLQCAINIKNTIINNTQTFEPKKNYSELLKMRWTCLKKNN